MPSMKKRSSASMKFRSMLNHGAGDEDRPKGTKPLAEPASVGNVLAMMIVHVARKILYGIDISQKVGMYIIGILVLSVLSDFVPMSSHYMSSPSNVFNVYFVKYGWAWTFFITGAFVFVSSLTYSCGNVNVIKNQVIRLIIATGVWYGLTAFFLYIEETSGICNATRLLNKSECIENGFSWKGFDISGHCFLLVWNNLFIIEEAKAYIGWEQIKDMIRNEEHRRRSTDLIEGSKTTVLSKLTLEEFLHLRENYAKYTGLVRLLFCLMGALVMLWDVMLVCTALYFHIMIEKVIACLAAVIVWFVLYRAVYVHPWSPGLPGEGPFKYVTFKAKMEVLQKKEQKRMNASHCQDRWQSKDEVPKFMGMPLYALDKKRKVQDQEVEESSPKTRLRSRSSSLKRFSSSKNALNEKNLR